MHPHRFRSTTHHKNSCQQDLSHLSIHPLRNQEVFAYLCPVLSSEFHPLLRTLLRQHFQMGFTSVLCYYYHIQQQMFSSISNQHAYNVVLWLPPLTYPWRCFNKKGSLALSSSRPILLAPARTSHPSGVGGEAGAPVKEVLGKARAAQVASFPSMRPSY